MDEVSQMQAGHQYRMAEQLVSIAESLSIEALGLACSATIGEMTGSPTLGLHLFEDDEPALVYSGHVAEGLLDCYKSGLWKSDPVLDYALATGHSADGASLVGRDNWRRSLSFGALRESGLRYNMGGPLKCGGKIIGMMYTATGDMEAPYTPLHKQHMDLVCRAGSIAIINMINFDPIDGGRNVTMLSRPARPSLAFASAKLSPRLAAVAVRLCRGQTNKEIAREIGISDHTVKDHVAILCRRFGVDNRTHLAARLTEGGVA